MNVFDVLNGKSGIFKAINWNSLSEMNKRLYPNGWLFRFRLWLGMESVVEVNLLRNEVDTLDSKINRLRYEMEDDLEEIRRMLKNAKDEADRYGTALNVLLPRISAPKKKKAAVKRKRKT
jgi:outer membrane murein-binding lipoprotein Lpp